ncbi:hypothetical protein [Natrononativus amylolyticus]|uniref:hypothetical protein n=1 Tax=Natrononativus amylolyticus TaxID=2963434 RepID=UPI0020CD3DD7|nr:hypothetical protein [Natrononativus amylolyticus]
MDDNNSSSVPRRTVLAAMPVGLAGCTSRLTGGSDSDDETFLGIVDIGSRYDNPLTVDMQVEWEEETVLDDTFEIEAYDESEREMGGIVPERTWPDEKGQWSVSSRVEGDSDWLTTDPAQHEYPDCLSVRIRLDPNGFHEHLVGTQPEQCSDEMIEVNQD